MKVLFDDVGGNELHNLSPYPQTKLLREVLEQLDGPNPDKELAVKNLQDCTE